MFTESERKVFEYFNGEKKVWADPLTIQRRLRQHLVDQDKVVTALNSANDADGDAVAERFLDAVAKAFEIPKLFDPLTGSGFTEKNLHDLWNLFQKWVDEKKNPPGNSPGTYQPTHRPPDLPR